MKYLKGQSGISLVEVLVAVAISGILLAGVVQIFLSTRQAYTTMDAASRLQEDGRFALNFIAGDLRETGYYGCNGRQLGADNLLTDAGATVNGFYRSDIVEPITGFEADTANGAWIPGPAGAGALAAAPAAVYGNLYSDILAVRIPLEEAFGLTNDVITGSSTFTLDVTNTDCNGIPEVGQVVVLSDCQGATVVQVDAVADDVACPNATARTVTLDGTLGNPGNATTSFSRDLGADLTEAYRMVTRVYYVDLNGDGVPALFRRTDTAAPVELVTGVEAMQVRYGVDTADPPGFANIYQDANTVNAANNWDSVVSARIGLLIRSVDAVKTTPEALQHCLLGDPMNDCAGGEGADSTNADNWTDTNDRFIHHVYTTTIVFRNRIPVL